MRTKHCIGLMIVGGGLLLSGGCEAPPPPCEEQLGGQCVGVPAGDLCGSDVCTEGVECDTTIEVATSAELGDALSNASPGTCVAVKPGTYGDASVPAGVSLLGKSADKVTLGSVTLADGALVRGVTIGGNGVAVSPGAHVTIRATHVAGSTASGVTLGDGAALSMDSSEVTGAALYGVYGGPSTTVDIVQSLVSEGGGPGIWLTCKADCCDTASERPYLHLERAIVRANRIVGVALWGTDADIHDVTIEDTKPGDLFNFGEGGGGLSVAGCSALGATALRSNDNRLYGALVDGSSATMAAGDAGGIELKRNLMGMWVQFIHDGRQVHVVDAAIEDNEGVGLGVDGTSRGIIFCKSHITGTKLKKIPVTKNNMVGFQQQVGDGISWLGGSLVRFDEVEVSGNARAGVLINGEVGTDMAPDLTSSLEDMTITNNNGNDLLQQSYTGADAAPLVSNVSAALVQDDGEVLEVPVGPGALGQDL